MFGYFNYRQIIALICFNRIGWDKAFYWEFVWVKDYTFEWIFMVYLIAWSMFIIYFIQNKMSLLT